MQAPSLDDLPGFRRRIVITPGAGRIRAEVEDDYHHMAVTLLHEGNIATRVEGDMMRIPWITCPGAPAVLSRTFEGVPLKDFGRRGEKTANCTHLHDLAIWAAAHAHDTAPLIYDILVSDPIEGVLRAELRANGAPALGWSLRNGQIAEPANLAGLTLDKLRGWIDSLDEAGQEQARILRWATILAHGRRMKEAELAKAIELPLPQARCYTFDPEMVKQSGYIGGTVRDFSGARQGTLAGLPLVQPMHAG